MKKIFSLLGVMIFSMVLLAQQVPQGMKYQAVARNLKGEILANEQILLRINLSSQKNGNVVTHYSEVHEVVTNEVGLFTLVVGEGKAGNNKFSNVPWSTDDIWMEISIGDKGKKFFSTISNSKLLAVPYAFHAATANQLINKDGSTITMAAKVPGNESPTPTSGNAWNTSGNLATNPLTDFIGTADNTDLIFKSNGTERLRITADGKLITPNGSGLELGGNLQVNGDSVIMKKYLFVGEDVVLNYKPWDLAPGSDPNGTPIIGQTINRGNFTVSDMSSTVLTGSLTVEKLVRFNDATTSTTAATGALVVTGGVGIGENLNVGGITKLLNVTQSTNKDDGALIVDGGVGVEKNLNVGGIAKMLNNTTSTTTADGALVITGGVGIGDNLNVANGINSKSLNITNNSQGYLATFINTNTDNGGIAGDGIKIQLGKEKALDLGAFQLPSVGTFLPGITGAISNSIFTNGAFNTSLTAETFLTNLSNGVTSDVLGYVDILKASLCNLTNVVIDEVNKGLGLTPNGLVLLPATHLFGPSTAPQTVITAIDVALLDVIPDGYRDDLNIPSLDIPEIKIPKIPNITDCPPLTNPFNWDLSWPTATSNPLTHNNEFIGFFDNNGEKVGAVRGQSLEDFIGEYTDIPHLVEVASTFINGFDVDAGTPDPFSAVRIGAKAFNYFIQTWDAIGKIGVEYSSGNGDYAEWLERMNPDEVIGTGDIVAVKGGKITKDIKDAEQIMAVSHHPIVLGNVPDKNRTPLGNNIAFMGQIPVKVMGPVKAGDYIVAKSDIPGYGVAVDPLNMKVEDYKLTVGRSWTTDMKNGLKMVNTVVGVHNNNFLDLIKELKEKTEENDLRLKAIESKLNISSSDSKIYTEKKAFK